MGLKLRVCVMMGALWLAALPLAAKAELIGFRFVVSGNDNAPRLTLTNTSAAASIESFTFSIGDTTRNFNIASAGSNTFASPWQPPPQFVGNTMTLNSSGSRVDVLDIGFSGFTPNEFYQTDVDIDRDNSDTMEYFRRVFFNNGTAPNSQVNVAFSTGNILSAQFIETPSYASQYVLTASANLATNAVPEPGSMLLMGLAIAGLAYTRGSRPFRTIRAR